MEDKSYIDLLTQRLTEHRLWLQSKGENGVCITRDSFKPILNLHNEWRKSGKKEGNRLNLELVPHELRNLDQADLSGADLEEANLQEVDLQHANLRNAYLRNANLQHANLLNANLLNANLQHANLREANLQNANLQNANLQDANLQEADLQNAILQNAKLQNADLQNANLQHAKLRNADLQNADLQLTSFAKSNLNNVDFKGCLIKDCDFQESDLSGANFVGVKLEGEKNIFFGAKAGKIKALPNLIQILGELGADLTTGLGEKEVVQKLAEIKETKKIGEAKDLILEGINELQSSITHIDKALSSNEGLSTMLTIYGISSFIISVCYVIVIGCFLNVEIIKLGIDHAYGLAVPIFMFLLIGSALLRHDAKNRAQFLTLTQEKNKLQKAAGLMQAAYAFAKEKRIRLGEENKKPKDDLVDITFRTITKSMLTDVKLLDDPEESSTLFQDLLNKIPNPK